MAKQTPKDESAMPYEATSQGVMLTPEQLVEMGYHMAAEDSQPQARGAPAIWKDYSGEKVALYARAKPLEVQQSLDSGMSPLEVLASLSKEEVEVWTESLPMGQLSRLLDELSPSAFGFYGISTPDREKEGRIRYAVKSIRDELDERTSHTRSMRSIAASEQAREDGRVGRWSFSAHPDYPFTVKEYYKTIGIKPSGSEVRVIVPLQYVPEDIKATIEDMIEPERQRYLAEQEAHEQMAAPEPVTEPYSLPTGEDEKPKERGPGLGRPGDGRVSALGEALGKGGH